jgi:putative ABC transport system ATP-binding protein
MRGLNITARQQQRVSVGRALINAPVVMDLLIGANKRFHQTLIVITHDEKIALQADRVITIKDGGIIRDEEVRR